MRAPMLAVAVLVAALALGGCGDDEPSPARTIPFEPPTERGVGGTIRDYVRALNDGDGQRACPLLDENGQASLISFLPSSNRAIPCETAVERVARQVVPLRRFRIERVKVSGRSATAEVKAIGRPYSSGVLLSNRGDGWKISFPPGLESKSGNRKPPRAVPGVPLEKE